MDVHVNFGRSIASLVLHTVCCRKCCKTTRDHDHRNCRCSCHR